MMICTLSSGDKSRSIGFRGAAASWDFSGSGLSVAGRAAGGVGGEGERGEHSHRYRQTSTRGEAEVGRGGDATLSGTSFHFLPASPPPSLLYMWCRGHSLTIATYLSQGKTTIQENCSQHMMYCRAL